MSSDQSHPVTMPRNLLPVSAVSPWVGMMGLIGLFSWIIICRNWAGLADALNLSADVPREPMNGPYAAVATIFFAGMPMVLWSVLIDKVHLRASTGIDWRNPKPLRDVIDTSITKLAGLWATWAIIATVYCLARFYWRDQYLFSMEILGMAAPLMFALSIPYVLWLDRVLVNPRDGCWHFGAMLIGREAYDRAELWHHLRAWAVKGFFCAFMISILPGGFSAIVTLDLATVAGNPVAISVWLTELLFLIDVHIAMVGYLLTMKPLDSHIRTANPYLAGWVAALMCYPPFILMGSGGVLDYHVNTRDWAYWFEGREVLLWVWAALLVLLTGIYAWATVAFGIRFSNLTHRGILTNGPYRFTKHPAYLSKNLYWWLAVLPFLVTSGSMTDAIRNCAILAIVSAIYFWRAKTEEAHLMPDPAYRDYAAWMSQNALITRSFERFTRRSNPVAVFRDQPAE